MFVGHYGVAFALKRLEPRISLGVLFIAVQLVDLLWGGTLLLGWEHARVVPGYLAASPLEFLDFPITHSLVAGIGWGVAAALLYFSWPTTNVSHHSRAALIVGLAVLSHWPLDVLVHARDLPIYGADSAKIGFGLWRSVPLTLMLELGFLAVGIALYVTMRSRRHPVRRTRLAILLVVMLGVFLSSFFGPPPSDMRIIGIGAIVICTALGALAWWADRPVPEPAAEHRHGPRARHT